MIDINNKINKISIFLQCGKLINKKIYIKKSDFYFF